MFCEQIFVKKIFRSKKNKRSRSRDRKHRRSRSKTHSRSRSSSGDRRRHRREERYERDREPREIREPRETKETRGTRETRETRESRETREPRETRESRETREAREKELEKERLREIALEFKQSGAFSSIAQSSQSFLQPQEQAMSIFSSFPTFNTFPIANIIQPAIEIQQFQPKERSQAYLEALEASKRIAASKNFIEALSCSNSNDSASNGPMNIEGSSNSSKFIIIMPTVIFVFMIPIQLN